MQKKILIFEKNLKKYLELCEILKEKGYDVNEGINKFGEQCEAIHGFFKPYAIDEIRHSLRNGLGGVICNHDLSADLKGTDVVKHIRKYFPQRNSLEGLEKSFPIIGYSTKQKNSLWDEIRDWNIQRSFFSSGADFYLSGDELKNIGKVINYLQSKSNFISF